MTPLVQYDQGWRAELEVHIYTDVNGFGIFSRKHLETFNISTDS